jgi:hypothetical protein
MKPHLTVFAPAIVVASLWQQPLQVARHFSRSTEKLTAYDPGTDERDLETTVRIRRGIMARPDLSVRAKNAKVITVNGRVTIHGTVATHAERGLIAQLAESTASGPVDNQLRIQMGETAVHK